MARTKSAPLHCLDQDPRELVATTRCGRVRVEVYKNADKEMTQHFDGNTMWRRGVMQVDISARLFEKGNQKRLASVLLHEFVHVVEYCNSHEFLSPATNEHNCTELAQAMEEGLGDLFGNSTGLRFAAGWVEVQPKSKKKKKATR